MLKTVTFYKTSAEMKDKTLCQLIAKIYNSGLRAVIRCENQTFLDELNKMLWSYSQKEFIAHGGQADPYPERQPIYLTTGLELPNNATVVMNIGPLHSAIDDFERAIFVLDNADEHDLSFAKKKYDYFKSQQLILEYWQQTPQGAWEKVQ